MLLRSAQSERDLVGMEAPDDATIDEILQSCDARFGVLLTFAILAGTPHLAIARVVERRAGAPLRHVARRVLQGENDHLPAAAMHVLGEVLNCIGDVSGLPPSWQEMFGTDDCIVASNYLTALGCHAQCQEGLVLHDPDAALRAVLSCVVPRMPAAIELLPQLVTSLRASGSAPDEMLVAAMRAGVQFVDVVPEGWTDVLQQLGIAAPSMPN